MTSAQTSAVRKLQAVLTGRGQEPLPETLRQTARDRKFVAPVVDLPQLGGDVRNERGGRIPRPERAGVKIDRHPLRQSVAHARAGESKERAPVALIDERGQAGKGGQERLHAGFGPRNLRGDPLVWSHPDERDCLPHHALRPHGKFDAKARSHRGDEVPAATLARRHHCQSRLTDLADNDAGARAPAAVVATPRRASEGGVKRMVYVSHASASPRGRRTREGKPRRRRRRRARDHMPAPARHGARAHGRGARGRPNGRAWEKTRPRSYSPRPTGPSAWRPLG